MILRLEKSIVVSVLLCFAQSAISGSTGRVLGPYDGLYMGGDIGVSNLVDSTSTTSPLAGHHMSSTGIVGGGLIGYDYSLTGHIKLGFEGFAHANGLNASSVQLYSPVARYQVSSRYNLGARLLPGYSLDERSTGHLLLGYTYAKFNVMDNGNYGYIDQNFYKSGFQCGLGMKTHVTQKLSLRADALYSTYAHASNRGTSNIAPYGQQTYHNNFSMLEGDLTLLYQFN